MMLNVFADVGMLGVIPDVGVCWHQEFWWCQELLLTPTWFCWHWLLLLKLGIVIDAGCFSWHWELSLTLGVIADIQCCCWCWGLLMLSNVFDMRGHCWCWHGGSLLRHWGLLLMLGVFADAGNCFWHHMLFVADTGDYCWPQRLLLRLEVVDDVGSFCRCQELLLAWCFFFAEDRGFWWDPGLLLTSNVVADIGNCCPHWVSFMTLGVIVDVECYWWLLKGLALSMGFQRISQHWSHEWQIIVLSCSKIDLISKQYFV